jgi:hypothetical protein
MTQEPAMSSVDNGDEPGRVVRPYAITGGRTRSSRDGELELEALVSTTSAGEAAATTLNVDWRSIALLCRDILSVAEIAARLDVPLGVARVLIGDMAEEGLVLVHRPQHPGDRPDLALLERVLYGLREI